MFEEAYFSKICNSWSPILTGMGQHVTQLHDNYVIMMMIMVPNSPWQLRDNDDDYGL